MTILQPSKSSQGDSDEPPPKKKLKKSKNSIRGPAVSHNVSLPEATSAPGPSHKRPEPARDLYQLYETDHVIEKFTLDKFDVGIPPRSSTLPAPLPYDYAAAGPSHGHKTQYNNPDCLEYYIYGPGSRSPNSKSRPLKRPPPDVDLIEVISTEEIEPPTRAQSAPTLSDGISLLDDINNFDFDDKFGVLDKIQQDALWEDSKLQHVDKSADEVVLPNVPSMNGYDKGALMTGPRSARTWPASLSNLGNTCFLNCVLYTLRFAPNFLHNLHHLVNDINAGSNDVVQKKTASLGRSVSLMSKVKKEKVYSGAGDLAGRSYPKTSKQIVTERLHEVYEAMRRAEDRGHADPYHPEIFLTALREVNPIFEGNQQQDAHELLVCLLDIFRETSQAVSNGARNPHDPTSTFDINSQSGGSSRNSSFGKGPTVWFKNRWMRMKNKKNVALNDSPATAMHVIPVCDESGDESAALTENPLYRAPCDRTEQSVLPPLPHPAAHNFVAQDFEGVMVLATTCLECENTTEKNEPFADICVPIETETDSRDANEEDVEKPVQLDASELYKRAVVTDEYLREHNKYYCEACLRYNEARRSVSYRRLPRLLTLQLKRFSSTFGAMSKVTAYMPTPMTLSCFCEVCLKGTPKHRYELYGVIMHLGSNMAGGHYIAYVRAADGHNVYCDCPRDWPKPGPVKPSLQLFSKTSGAGEAPNGLTSHRTCRAHECCAIRPGPTDPQGNVGYEDSCWMVCDDEIVKYLTAAEVETQLTQKSTSNATPYLLFYVLKTD